MGGCGCKQVDAVVANMKPNAGKRANVVVVGMGKCRCKTRPVVIMAANIGKNWRGGFFTLDLAIALLLILFIVQQALSFSGFSSARFSHESESQQKLAAITHLSSSLLKSSISCSFDAPLSGRAWVAHHCFDRGSFEAEKNSLPTQASKFGLSGLLLSDSPPPASKPEQFCIFRSYYEGDNVVNVWLCGW